MIFNSKPDIERPGPDRRVYDDLIPLSHLGLELDTTPNGWVLHLERRGIAVLTDDIGRRAISRSDAKQLLDEKHAEDVRKAKLRAVQEREAVEADRAWRAQLGQGVSAAALAAGMSYAEAVHAAELASQPYRPRTSVAEDLLDNGGSGLTFHSLGPVSDGE